MKRDGMDLNGRFWPIGLAAAAAYWLIESFNDSYIKGVNSFGEAFFTPPWYELWSRIMISALFIVAAVVLEKQHARRLRAEKELEKKLNETKFFAYSVSHDLKNPAISVHGLANRLAEKCGSSLDEKGLAYCGQIKRAAELIVNLVDAVNVFIATKEMPLRLEAVSLAEICRMIEDEFSDQLTGRGITLFCPDAPDTLMADKLSVIRALGNLIANALQHGTGLKQIRIGYEAKDGFHYLSVTDDGGGISGIDQKNLFEPFKKGGAPLKRHGCGLGLAIVKEIAEKHGGMVWAETGPGKGATFFFSIAVKSDGK